MKKSLLTAVFITGAIFVGTMFQSSYGWAASVVEERMHGMAEIAKAGRTINDEFRKGGDYDAELVRQQAAIIKSNAGVALTKLYPEGSDEAASRAKPAIWTDWEQFETLAVQLETGANAVIEASDKDTAFDAFVAMGQSCQSCHSQFRSR